MTRTDSRGTPAGDAIVSRAADLEATMRERLAMLREGTSLCPSDIARAVDPEHWRGLMDETRRTARLLAAEGTAEVTQRGRVVDPDAARGPIRIRPRRGSVSNAE